MASRKDRGDKAENLACKYLEKQNIKILKRNFHGRQGELDIVGRQDNCICVVEVRSRGKGSAYVPEQSLTGKKRSSLRKTTNYFLAKHGLSGRPLRMDLLVIDWETGDPEIRFYPGTIRESPSP